MMSRHAYTTIDLLRHGQAQGGEIFRGHTDVPLSDLGWTQMQTSIDALGGWQQIVTSPMQRCRLFAEQTQQALDDVPCEVVESLKEISFGDWDGQTFEAVRETYGDRFFQYWQNPIQHTPPNAEPMLDFCERIRQAFWQQIEEHQGKHVLMIVHGGVIRAILAEVLKSDNMSLMRYDVPYACVTRFRIYHDDGQHWPQLVFHNLLAEP